MTAILHTLAPYAALAILTAAALWLARDWFDRWLGHQMETAWEPIADWEQELLDQYDADRTPIGDAALRDVLARRLNIAADEWAAAESAEVS